MDLRKLGYLYARAGEWPHRITPQPDGRIHVRESRDDAVLTAHSGSPEGAGCDNH